LLNFNRVTGMNHAVWCICSGVRHYFVRHYFRGRSVYFVFFPVIGRPGSMETNEQREARSLNASRTRYTLQNPYFTCILAIKVLEHPNAKQRKKQQ
jgi:hypothetical protein